LTPSFWLSWDILPKICILGAKEEILNDSEACHKSATPSGKEADM